MVTTPLGPQPHSKGARPKIQAAEPPVTRYRPAKPRGPHKNKRKRRSPDTGVDAGGGSSLRPAMRGPDGSIPQTGFRALAMIVNFVMELDATRGLLDPLIEARQKTKRGYGPDMMFRCMTLQYLCNVGSPQEWLSQVRSIPAYQRICRFDELTARQYSVPSEGTYSKFRKIIADQPKGILRRINEEIIDLLGKRPAIAGFGETLAIDSTDVEAWASPHRSTILDPSAHWGVRMIKGKRGGSASKRRSTSRVGRGTNASRRQPPRKVVEESKDAKKGESRTEWFFGYKLHTLIDVGTGIPLSWVLLPANLSEIAQLSILLEKAMRRFDWLKPKHLLADRGYDTSGVHEYLVAKGITPIIPLKRAPTTSKLHEVSQMGPYGEYLQEYSVTGAPMCDQKTEMNYVLTDPKSGWHLYRCPDEGCALKNRAPPVRWCENFQWAKPEDSYRVIGVAARASLYYQMRYKGRMVVERFFNSAKSSRLLDCHAYFDMYRIEAHAEISMMAYLATVFHRVSGNRLDLMRRMRVATGRR